MNGLIPMGVVLFFLMASTALAGEEVVHCSIRKGEPVVFRKGECRLLDDPTFPTGAINRPEARQPATHSVKSEESGGVGSPGPWKVSQILVPSEGEDGRNFVRQAVINGHRYRVGEWVDGGVVKEIAQGRVVISHDGKETTVLFDKSTPATALGRVGSIPLILEPAGVYSIKIRINNNQEILAVLDTGASQLALPEDVVAWLVRSGTLKPTDFVGVGKAVIADGSSFSTRSFKIHSLRVGDVELRDVEGIEVPNQKKETETAKNKKKSTKEKSLKKSSEWTELTRPLFGLQELMKIGKWRIDHANSQLIVER
ncbi:MAG: retroviral-like aspartic protease family protein [Magnetococcales bacterium]|nr:retroviral-like aspartic protease family protein [Magnetococcales bacterium]MBF0439977.1 retroviral-like aspartic protease family protein [Magnetococcales bacterium]